MPSVTIGGQDRPSYAGIGTATGYLAADMNYSQPWELASDRQAQALVMATRELSALEWRSPFGYDDAPQEVIDACCLLAGMLVKDSQAIAKARASENNSEVSAGGGVTVKRFRRIKGTALPIEVLQMVSSHRAASGSIGVFVGASESQVRRNDYA